MKLTNRIQICVTVLLTKIAFLHSVFCFVLPIAKQTSINQGSQKWPTNYGRNVGSMKLDMSIYITQEQQLEFWITTFSSAHIGMSAIRGRLIDGCAKLAENANIIDRGIQLPSYWPGDDFGKNDLFPDSDTAGRQIYRFAYTIISFTTLGGALTSYLSSSGDTIGVMALSERAYVAFHGIAALSFAASIASLFNASPMSLMPSFQKADDTANSIAGLLQRNDSLKMEPRGLTRITRHPLILPVVPWGLATSYLAGGRICDFVLFGGLSLYAIAGCACQDLRISRQEGSVGTVMSITTNDIGTCLQNFYQTTSFIPFAAIIDGRQPINLVAKEFPIIPFIAGIPIGYAIEKFLLGQLVP